ncbi:MAG TPA: BrnA antitoxin family protein [Longimicrobiaceae bacterium]|nr:BrnA antitoxin family protein [Longimicrobiaceae bacterium]
MKNTSGRRHHWDDLSDEEIDALEAASGEFPKVTEEDLRRAVAVSAAGRVKVPISIRVDEEALEFFKAQGPGYQTRINAVLLAYARGELGPARRSPPHPRREEPTRVTVARRLVVTRAGARMTNPGRAG